MNKTSLFLTFFFIGSFFSQPANAIEKHPRFSIQAWNSIRPLYKKIIHHPFNVQLANGSLKQETFTFYQMQDGYYLITFSKTLAILASKVSDLHEIKLLLDFAKDALNEKNDSLDVSFHQITPANFSYTNFLLNIAAHGSKGEIAAALLPCFWIYAEVAKNLKQKSTLDKGPYFKWISTYSSEGYEKNVKQMISLTDRLFREAGPTEKKKMHEAFIIATKLELYFWDDAFFHRIF